MFTATAQPIDGTLRQRVAVNGRHEIMTDEPESLGGLDTAPAPHELLPAMLASCVSTMVLQYAQHRGWELNDLAVEVRYENESRPRDVAMRMHLPATFSADQVARLQRIAEACPVKRALEAGFNFAPVTVTREAGRSGEPTDKSTTYGAAA
jgi:putative redox protein